MNLPYTNVRQAADDLKRKHFPGLKVLSYNWRNPHGSNLVWLKGTDEKRAFAYAKFKLTTDNDYVSENEIFAGINIEKGLPVPPGTANANDIMDERWFWHRFLELSATPFFERIAEASDALGQELKLVVTAATLTDRQDKAFVMFDVHGNDLTLDKSGGTIGLMHDLPKVTHSSAFSDELKKLNADERLIWYWMEVSAGLVFTRDVEGESGLEQCAKMLKPFEDWLLKTPK